MNRKHRSWTLTSRTPTPTCAFEYFADDSPLVRSYSGSCVASNEALDYALLRLPDDAPMKNPLRLRTRPGIMPKERQLRERGNVLQHRDGAAIQRGFRNNSVVTGSEAPLSYLPDTARGASGSPICDDKWHVTALHRGWQTMEQPVAVWGLDIQQKSYGRPLAAILEDLKASHQTYGRD